MQIEIEDDFRRKTLKAFMPDRRIKTIPSQYKKRLVLYEEISKDFLPGRDYTESEVSDMLLDRHTDYCYLRRELVTEGFLTRENCIYRRAQT